jgi:Protein of unknown function (DUF3592)
VNTVAVVLAVMFLIGLIRGIQTYFFLRKAVRVRARIVESLDASVANHDTSSQSASVSRYVVELPDQSGRKRRVTLADAFGGSMAERLVAHDDTIAVTYDPSTPSVVRIDSPWTLYFIPVFLCAPGVLFIALIVYVWIKT